VFLGLPRVAPAVCVLCVVYERAMRTCHTVLPYLACLAFVASLTLLLNQPIAHERNTCKAALQRGLPVDQSDALLVRSSREAGAGSGLFAARAVPNGTVLAAYCGTLRPPRELLNWTDFAFIMSVGAYHFVDARPHADVLARYANHAFNSSARNAAFDRGGGSFAILRATRPLRAGDEVLVDHGDYYWDTTCKKNPHHLPTAVRAKICSGKGTGRTHKRKHGVAPRRYFFVIRTT
jgi:hypothetical protein